MKLRCPACQARYVLADEKIAGKIMKIRCRKCGGIVVAQGAAVQEPPGEAPASEVAPPKPPDPPRTGERHEDSVLFSLSALTARPGRDRSSPPTRSESSGLVDLRMLAAAASAPKAESLASAEIAGLGSGGLFVPPLVLAPCAETRQRPPMPWALAIGGIALLLAAPLSLALRRVSPAAQPVPLPPETAVSSAATPPPQPVAEGSPTPVVTRAQEPIAAADRPLASRPAPARPSPAPQPVPVTEPVASSPPRGTFHCCTWESETDCAIRRAAGGECNGRPAPALAPFDKTGAAHALGAADLHACVSSVGSGHAHVTFEPTGGVSHVSVDASALSGTAAERCVLAAFGRVRVSPFSGEGLTVGKRFVLPPAP
jgi:predicted Zn finger-like uncharacterized protein